MYGDNYRTVLAPGHSSTDDYGGERNKRSLRSTDFQNVKTQNQNPNACQVSLSPASVSISTREKCISQDVRIVMAKRNQACKEEAVPNRLSSAASLEYKNRLEEMELRIRYMKNDIEFKQGQMTSKSKQDVQIKQQLARHCFPNNKEDSKAGWRKPTPSVSPYNTSIRAVLPHWNRKLIHGSNPVSQYLSNSHLMNKDNLSRQTTLPVAHSQLSLYSSPVRKDVTQSSSLSASLPSFTQSLTQGKLVQCTVPQSTSYPSSSPSCCHHSTMATKQGNLNSLHQQQTQVQAAQVSGSILSQCPSPTVQTFPVTNLNSSSHSPNTFPYQPPGASLSPYKLVKPKSMTNTPASQASCSLNTAVADSEIFNPTENHTSFISTERLTISQQSSSRKYHHSNSLLVKKHTPLKVQTAARLVCSKYRLKRLSPTSIKTAPRFPIMPRIKPVSQEIQSSTTPSSSQLYTASNNKYKLVKHLDVDHRKDTVFQREQLVPTEGTTLPIPSATKLTLGRGIHQFKSNIKNCQMLKFHTSKTLPLPTSDARSLSLVRGQSLSSTMSYASSRPDISSSSKSTFKLDKRGALHQNFKTSKFKLDKRLIRTCSSNHDVVALSSIGKRNKKQKHELRLETSSSLYKWRQGQRDSSRGIAAKYSLNRNATSRYRWQHRPLTSKTSGLQKGQQSPFKWHRPNSRDEKISRRKVEMIALKQRLKVIMYHRNASVAKWRSKSRVSQSCPHSSPYKMSSPLKGKGNGRREEDVNRLVMIGHMLYKASSKKLTRADTRTSLKQNQHASPKLDATSEFGPKGNKHHLSSFTFQQQTAMTPKRKLSESVVVKSLRPQKMKLVTVRGIRFHVEANGTKLSRVDDNASSHKQDQTSMRRVDIGGMTYVKTGPDTLELSSQGNKKMAASRALHKSMSIVAAKQRRNVKRVKNSKRKHCMFYSRFGKCQHGDLCPFIHDPDKVAVCARFLRGLCEEASSCPFSHDASEHKMPVCLFYLQGLCSRQDCLYLHVKVSPDAPPCNDFLQGFCPLGRKCKKLHSFVCPSYAVFGRCPSKDTCTLLHRHRKNRAAEGNGKMSGKKKIDSNKKRSPTNTKGSDKTTLNIIDKRNPESVNNPSEMAMNATLAPLSTSTSSTLPPLKDIVSRAEEKSSSLSLSLSSSLAPSSSGIHFHSTTPLIPATDCVLVAQPSFISLLSTSSTPSSSTLSFPSPSLLNHPTSYSIPRFQSSTVATTTTFYKKPKITPEFIRPLEATKRDSNSKNELDNDKYLLQGVEYSSSPSFASSIPPSTPSFSMLPSLKLLSTAIIKAAPSVPSDLQSMSTPPAIPAMIALPSSSSSSQSSLPLPSTPAPNAGFTPLECVVNKTNHTSSFLIEQSTPRALTNTIIKNKQSKKMPSVVEDIIKFKTSSFTTFDSESLLSICESNMTTAATAAKDNSNNASIQFSSPIANSSLTSLNQGEPHSNPVPTASIHVQEVSECGELSSRSAADSDGGMILDNTSGDVKEGRSSNIIPSSSNVSSSSIVSSDGLREVQSLDVIALSSNSSSSPTMFSNKVNEGQSSLSSNISLSSVMFNKGIIPSFMTKMMQNKKK